jgi:hypothetical protein
MSKQYSGGLITKNPVTPTTNAASGVWTLNQASYWRKNNVWPIPSRIPGAPTIGTATAADTSASVAFTAPADLGIPATITSYTATSSPGGLTGTGASSPVTVSGLTNGTSYTFTVTATNSFGTGPASAASNSATPNPFDGTIQFLVVAGGGSGGMQGNRSGGGGGAGGLKTSYSAGGGPSGSQLSVITVTSGTNYTVTVGAGGASTPAGSPQHGFQGGTSVFSTISTTGGGGGGGITNYGTTSPASRKDGGSSGGANGYENTPGTAVANEGYTGGTGQSTETNGGLTGYAQGSGGGGGGASAVGANGSGSSSSLLGGNGGAGRTSSITGSSVTYAGGGGGAATNYQGAKTAGVGGSGGGGAGGISGSTGTMNGTAGDPNTGGGGGGASQHPENGSGWPGRSGAGGSGVVILRYAGGMTITLGAGLTGTTATDGASKVTTITAGTGNVSWT